MRGPLVAGATFTAAAYLAPQRRWSGGHNRRCARRPSRQAVLAFRAAPEQVSSEAAAGASPLATGGSHPAGAELVSSSTTTVPGLVPAPASGQSPLHGCAPALATQQQPCGVSPTQPVITAGPVPLQAVLPPAKIYDVCAAMGAYKAASPAIKTLTLAVAAGCYTALFGALLLAVGPNCAGIAASNAGLAKYITGAIGLPFQLLIIVTCGAELFTGATALVPAAVYEGRTSVQSMLRCWGLTLAGNVLGCALGVALLVHSGLLPQLSTGVKSISLAKLSYPLGQSFVKAVLASWFVCLAVWQSAAAQTFGGKFVAVLGPLSAFIACGFEHSVANCVFVPLGILTGVPGVTWTVFLLNNLLPVLAGNIVAGALCVAAAYSLAYGALGKRVEQALER